jgi:hypothetical protein
VRQSHRVADTGPTVQSLPGPHPGVGPGTCGTPGPANRAAEPGIKARATAHSASNRARTAQEVRGFHPAEGSGTGSGQQHDKEGLGKLGAGGQGKRPGAAARYSVRHRPTGPGAGVGSHVPAGSLARLQTPPRQARAGPRATAGLTRGTPGPAEQLDSDHLATVQFRPSSVSQVRATVTLERDLPRHARPRRNIVH